MRRRLSKKILAALTAAMLTAVMMAGCGNGKGQTQTESGSSSVQVESEEPAEVNVTALKGPTAMGMVRFMDLADQGMEEGADYTFSIAASADEVTPALVQGKTDIAAVPANLASVLYNKTEGQIRVLAVNTLGVLYLVENGSTVQSVEDLRGKTIYASGKGSTPEYALAYVLSANGLDPEKDVTIEWKSEHSECVAALAAQENGIAMLPQPFMTTAQMKNSAIRTALDLTEEWEKVQEKEEKKSMLITGVVVARAEFVDEHPEVVEDFLEQYEESVEYVNENTKESAELIEKYDIVTADVAEIALPECNIVFLDGDEMKENLSGYLEVLKSQNPEAVGGEVPGDDFYYNG